MHELLVI